MTCNCPVCHRKVEVELDKIVICECRTRFKVSIILGQLHISVIPWGIEFGGW